MRRMPACLAVAVFAASLAVAHVAYAGGCSDVCGKVDKLERKQTSGCGTHKENGCASDCRAHKDTGCKDGAITCTDGEGNSFGDVESVDKTGDGFSFRPDGRDEPVSLVAAAGELKGIKPGDTVKIRCESRDGCTVTDIRKVRRITKLPERCVDIRP